jgi:hypothetical protein
MDNFILSIVTGIVTFVIIQCMVVSFKNIFIPWYQTITYRGKNIDGKWDGYKATNTIGTNYVQDSDSESTIIINQRGNKVTGELILTKQMDGTSCRKLFKILGFFIDTVLVADVIAKEDNTMGMGSVVMKLAEEGKKLKGKQTYISSFDWVNIYSRDLIWVRK